MNSVPWRRSTAVLLAGFLAARGWCAQEYAIDPDQSSVEFSIKNFGRWVKGRFTAFSGTIAYDGKNIARSSVVVTIQADSVDTGIRKRDKHLRSSDFFDVENYPELSFRSQSVAKSTEGYVLAGLLTIKGTTNRVDLPFTFSVEKPAGGKALLRAQAGGVIDRRDFGIDFGDSFSIGNKVWLRLRVRASP